MTKISKMVHTGPHYQWLNEKRFVSWKVLTGMAEPDAKAEFDYLVMVADQDDIRINKKTRKPTIKVWVLPRGVRTQSHP